MSFGYPSKEHYHIWVKIYDPYLHEMYKIIIMYQGKGTRDSIFKNISYETFVSFVYKHSTGYISPYA